MRAMDSKDGVPDDAELEDIIAELARWNAHAEALLGDPVRLDDLIMESNRLNEQVQRVLPADPLNVVAWVVFSIIALSVIALES